MRIGAMFGEVLRSLVKEPVTELYPIEHRETPDRVRGKLHWDPEKCTGCSLCAKECPANAIDMIVIDKKAKQFVMRYYVDRCIYCGQCVQNCRFDCVDLSKDEWELASETLDPYLVYYGDEAHVAGILAEPTGANTE
jgi:formate hydrogenlyase subunit 6/NADH:ubiquinone oxidoreductase subunit I